MCPRTCGPFPTTSTLGIWAGAQLNPNSTSSRITSRGTQPPSEDISQGGSLPKSSPREMGLANTTSHTHQGPRTLPDMLPCPGPALALGPPSPSLAWSLSTPSVPATPSPAGHRPGGWPFLPLASSCGTAMSPLPSPGSSGPSAWCCRRWWRRTTWR